MDLLKKYNVQFYKRYRNGKTYFEANGGGLAEFLTTFADLEEVQGGIDNVTYVLDTGIADWEHSTINAEIYTAWLNSTDALIYPSYGNTQQLLQSIPLVDFKKILELWLDFLNS